jgi:hypothetical protein
MSKPNKGQPIEPTTVTDSGFVVINLTPEEFQLVTIQIGNSPLHWNGRTYPAGATLGGIPLLQARKMVEDHRVRILGSFSTREQERDLSAIENQTSGNLDPRQWRPSCPMPGQRSAVFVNIAELEAIQNR